MLLEPLSIIAKVIFAILLVAGFGGFIWGVYSRFNLILKGAQPVEVSDNMGQRFKIFFVNVLFQKKLFKEPLRGIMHLFVFYGFLVYVATTTNQIIEGFIDGFHFPIIMQPADGMVAIVYAFTLDLFTLLVLLGLAYFAYRRWILRVPTLDRPSVPSAIVISMISVLMLSSLLLESASFAIMLQSTSGYSVAYSPIREFFASLIFTGTDQASLILAQDIGWWLHIIAVLSFSVYVPNSKHSHLVFAPFNFLFANLAPKGQMSKLDLEAEDGLWGVTNVNDYTWTSLLDGLSCIECARCTEQCPAFATNKPLNPKEVIVGVKHATMEKLPAIVRAKQQGQEELPEGAIFPEYIAVDTMWSCTTCMACVEACPVGNNPMEKMTDTRRAKVLLEADFPVELQNTFTNITNQGNPWGISAEKRADWAQGLDVPVLADKKEAEYLFWVGCAGSYDDRAKKVSVALVKLLKKAGVDFAILGTEESCNGDTYRRGGNEYSFQEAAAANVETINQYKIKKIVTPCPHCFNTIKNEYPQMGGNYEVVHHSELLLELIEAGKLPATNGQSSEKIAYHDSCYLGRYNDIYDAPRQVMEKSGKTVVNPERSKSKSFCCGAGGAQMWMEEKEPRINDNRTEELLQQGCTTIGVNCPFCMTMISDGVKNKDQEESVKVKDIAEILCESLKL